MTTTTLAYVPTPIAIATDTQLADLYEQAIVNAVAQERFFETAREFRRVIAKYGDARFLEGHEQGIESATKQAERCIAKAKVIEANIAPLEKIFNENRWARFYLVNNSNGHIHSSTVCSTCFRDTSVSWLPGLSGLTEAEAVAAHGEILCSICFPTAPAEWTNGISNAAKSVLADRVRVKAERLAKKVEKSLVPSDLDGGLLFKVGLNGINTTRLTTIAAAKTWLADSVAWNSEYPRSYADGTVRTSHPSYPPEAVALVADVLSVRLGSTPTVELILAEKRASRKR